GVSAGAAIVGGDPRGQAGGAADRRDRPRGRGVRGLPARGAVRLPDFDPRAGHRDGAFDPAGGADIQRDARALRRVEAALPLSFRRLSGRGQGGAYPDHTPAADRRQPRTADCRLRGQGAQGGPAQGTGRCRDAGLGGGAGRARGARSEGGARGGAGHTAVPAEDPGGPLGAGAGGDPAAARQGCVTVAAAGSAAPRVPPSTPLAGAQLRVRLAAFLNLLRDNGFLIGLEEARDSLRFAAIADLARPSILRTGLRSICCTRRADWQRFDELFDAYWLKRGIKGLLRVSGTPPRAKGARR